jgi:hypothetical protein
MSHPRGSLQIATLTSFPPSRCSPGQSEVSTIAKWKFSNLKADNAPVIGSRSENIVTEGYVVFIVTLSLPVVTEYGEKVSHRGASERGRDV